MMKTLKLFFVSCAIVFMASDFSGAQQLTKFQKWEQPSYFRGFDVGLWCSDSDCEKTQADIDSLKAAGANLAQINVYGAGFRNIDPPYNVNQEGIDWITTMVEYCRMAELQYVIAVRVGPGRYDVSDGVTSPIWQNAEQVKMYGKMLKEIAAAFLPDTLFVGMNLTVEPDPFTEEYLSPEDLKQTLLDNGVDLYQINKTWIDSVRTVAPTLPLIVQAAQYSAPEYWGDPVLIKKQNDPYIVYDFHTYEPFDGFTHHETIDGVTYPVIAWSETLQDDVLWDSTFYADVVFDKVKIFQQTFNAPIFMGEFGMRLPQNNGEEYLKDLYEIAIDNDWHFALWSWRADGDNGNIFFNYERFDEASAGANYWNTVKSFFSDFPTSIQDYENPNLPFKYELKQNYPNPFSKVSAGNPSTTIEFSLPVASFVSIEIFNSLGELIGTLANGIKPAGNHRLVWNAGNLPSGVYFYSLSASSVKGNREFHEVKKMILLR